MGVSTITGINLWLRREGLELPLSLIILAGIVFLACSVLQILWAEYRWYLYLSGALTVVAYIWFCWDTGEPRR